MVTALTVVVVLLIAAIFIQFRQVVELERDIERAIGIAESMRGKLVEDHEYANSLYRAATVEIDSRSLSQATRIYQMEEKWAKAGVKDHEYLKQRLAEEHAGRVESFVGLFNEISRVQKLFVGLFEEISRVMAHSTSHLQKHEAALLSHAETQDNILKRLTVIEGAYVTATGLETELKPLQEGLTDLIAKTTEHPKDAKKEETPRVRKNFASARQAASDGPVV